jgi:hypothetical protein
MANEKPTPRAVVGRPDPELHAKMEALCDKHGKSMNNLICDLMRVYGQRMDEHWTEEKRVLDSMWSEAG